MAELWTEIIDPVELSGLARDYMEEYELQNGTLARYLPNREVDDIAVEVVVGDSGLVPEANYRAYDAEPDPGAEPGGESIMLKLPAISQVIPVSEYTQLRARRASDASIRGHILQTMRRVVRAIADRAERTRGVVIATGKATVNQRRFGFDDDFGRSTEMSVTADNLWSIAASDRLDFMHDVVDAYTAWNGRPPGSLLFTRAAFALLGQGTQFRVQLNNGASRPMAADDVRQLLISDDLPPIDLYSRRTASGVILPTDSFWCMPEPVDPNDEDGSPYGVTTWGRTLTSELPDWGIEDESEQPGIVVGVTRHNGIPAIAKVEGDSISLPTAANADLAMRCKVIA